MVLRSLQQITDEVRRLRRQQGASRHLPEQLREAAAHLAAIHGIRSVSRDLAVNRNTLRVWMKRFPTASGSKPSKKSARSVATALVPAPIAFFEIGTSPTLPPSRPPEGATSTVELTRPDGWTVRVTGELAKALAPAILEEFFTTVRGGMT